MTGLIGKTMKLAPDLVARVEAHGAAHGLNGFTASAVDLIERGLTGRDGSAVLDALPKGPPPSPPSQAVTRDIVVARDIRRTPFVDRVVMGKGPARTTPAPATPKAPPPVSGRVSVAAIDLPIGRERPALGSMLKGPKTPKSRR